MKKSKFDFLDFCSGVIDHNDNFIANPNYNPKKISLEDFLKEYYNSRKTNEDESPKITVTPIKRNKDE